MMQKEGVAVVKSSFSFSYITNKISFNFFGKDSKKGQVTIFIILGILLLLAVVLMLLLKSEIISFKIDEIILTEKGKIENYLTNCISSVGEEALYLAGQQGGFIKVPERYSGDVGWHIKLAPFIYVPLWAKDNVVDRPSLSEIKVQIDGYIEENVKNCLFGDEAFQETYDLVEKSEISSDVNFGKGQTIFNLKWDIVIKDKAGEVVAEVINHISESDVRFKTIYETSSLILDKEIESLKLEDLTQDLIALEHEKLPVNGIELSCSQKQWKVSEAEETLKDMLRINVRELKVAETIFTEFPDIYPYYQNHYVWNIGEVDSKVSVVFRFQDNFPFNFQVTPRKGNYLLSGQLGGGDMLPILCVQSWKFTYDIVYPVVVEVRDEISGMTFQMGFTVNIIKNYPNKKATFQARESWYSSAVSDEHFCDLSSYYIPMSVETYSLVENPSTGVYDQQPLEGVNISYTCLKYKCQYGESEYDFENRGDVAGISSEFPYCAAAIVRGEKEGFVEDWEYVVPEEGSVIELNLNPLFRFSLSNVNVIKHKFEGRDCTDEEEERKGKGAFCYDISEGIEMSEEETAMITLTYSEQLDLEENETSDTINSSELEEAGIDFEIDLINTNEEIHKTEFVISKSLDQDFLAESYVEILAEADFDYDVRTYLVDDSELIGMYQGVWNIPWSDLGDNNSLTFHVLELNPNKEDEVLEMTLNIRDYSSEIPQPEIN